MAINIQQSRYVAPLDNGPKTSIPRVNFDTWWNKIVFVDNQGRKLTRKDLVLSVAEQDGGVHVDPGLNLLYAAVSRSNSLAWVTFSQGSLQPMGNPIPAAIRQITHEVLKSLKSVL
jgi:hypothetical protein